MVHDSKEENFNGSSLTFVQFCWVMAHIWIFEKCSPTPSYVLFMTTPLKKNISYGQGGSPSLLSMLNSFEQKEFKFLIAEGNGFLHTYLETSTFYVCALI